MAKKTDYYKKLGEQVAEARNKAKMSQSKMANLIGIDRSLISRFESQGEKLPAERINEILDILGLELGIVEKKKSLSPKSAKQRLQSLLKAAEDVVRDMNEATRIELPDFLSSPATGQSEQDDQHQKSET